MSEQIKISLIMMFLKEIFILDLIKSLSSVDDFLLINKEVSLFIKKIAMNTL